MGESFAETMRAKMTEEQREAIVKKVISMAAQGDIRAMVFIADRLDGKPAQRQIVAGDEGQPLIIRYIDPREPSDT